MGQICESSEPAALWPGQNFAIDVSKALTLGLRITPDPMNVSTSSGLLKSDEQYDLTELCETALKWFSCSFGRLKLIYDLIGYIDQHQ